MKNLISAKVASNLLLASLGVLSILHTLVLLRVIPADIVWGGQIQGVPSNLVTLETIALVVTLVFILIIFAKIGYLHTGKLSGAVNIGI